MRTGLRDPLAPLLITFIFLFLSSPLDPFPLAAQGGDRVEVAIRNFAYEVKGGIIRPDRPATIIVRNLDNVEHGFTSKFLEEVEVQVETPGATTFGRGIKGAHIRPAGEVRIHFIPNRPGRLTFTCDLHPNMKGEVLVLSVGAA